MKIACLLLCATAAAAQTTEGSLYDSLSGAPVTGAYVFFITNAANASRVETRSDAAGHFSLVQQVAGRMQPYISVERAGYLATRTQPQPIAGSSSELRIAMTPESFLSGRLVDQEGFPVQGASVTAVTYVVSATGERRLNVASGRTLSDDLGQFRIRNLPAGKYFLLVDPDNLMQWDRRYARQYLPGGSQPDEAHLVHLAPGQDHGLGELIVHQAASFNVTARVVLPAGSQSDGPVSVILQPADSDLTKASTLKSATDGKVTFDHVLPGHYTVVARTGGGGHQRRAGDYEATVALEVGSGDADAGVLTLQELHGVDLSGSVTVRDGSLPSPVTIRLRSDGVESNNYSATASPDGTFAFKGLLPGHYQVQVPALRSVKLGDSDVLQTGFDLDGSSKPPLRIVVSVLPLTVRGRLLDSGGRPQANAAVEFQSDSSGAAMSVHTGSDGWFHAGLPAPGAYHVLAASDGQVGTLSNQDYKWEHFHDFPVVQIVDGANQPILLTMPAAK